MCYERLPCLGRWRSSWGTFRWVVGGVLGAGRAPMAPWGDSNVAPVPGAGGPALLSASVGTFPGGRAVKPWSCCLGRVSH